MIEVRNLSKNFKEVSLFNEISYTFKDGYCYSLVGGNGSGKSVLMRLLAGFSKPDSGEVIVDGEVLGAKFDFIQNAGISINQPEFMGNWSGLNNLLYLADIRKVVGEDEIMGWVKRLSMEEAIKRKYKTYSQGMRQKMRIIQALMEKPKYLLLDEPFNALDEDSVLVVSEIFRAFKGPGHCIIFSCHDADMVEALSDVVLPIKELKQRIQKNA